MAFLSPFPTHQYFNPLPSCEGRRFFFDQNSIKSNFNPLPSCEGRLNALFAMLSGKDFNPLPSCEGRRELLTRHVKGTVISIHSPHARGDSINL